MLRLFSPFRRARRATPMVPKARLRVEQLEDRFCPAAPVISNLAAVHIGSSLVIIGHVNDESPGTVSVSLTGAVTASVTANAAGDFNYICNWNGGTAVTGQATDNQNLTSNQVTSNIANPSNANPYITLSVTYNWEKTVTLSGRVVDEVPNGRTVTFSGAASGTTTTDANGNFSLRLTANSLGSVTATTTDPIGQSSNSAAVQLTSSKPVISNFYCSELPGGWYEFTGDITDESESGLMVRFGGDPVSLLNQTTTVLPDGTFCLRIQLNGTQTDEGFASANLMDWWGIAADPVQCVVHQTGVG